MTAETVCRRCGDPLHMVATSNDEWDWVDTNGEKYRNDFAAWTREMFGVEALNFYQWLNWAAEQDWHPDHEKVGKCTRLELANYYSVFNSAMAFTIAQWVHQHEPAERPTFDGEVPWCCDWPMWLRPSGWTCRQRCTTSA